LKIDGFLLAMAAAITLAFIAPELGARSGPLHLAQITAWGISLIFFFHGAGMSRSALKSGLRNWRLHAVIQGTTFILFPLLGFALYFGTAIGARDTPLFSPDLRLGLFFLCAISSTISSSVALTGMARGNVPAAIFNATLSGLIGMVVTPLLIGLVAESMQYQIDLLDAMLDIFKTLLLPFALGQLLRPLLIDAMTRHKKWVTRLDRTIIVLIIFAAFCNSVVDGIWEQQSTLQLLALFALVLALLFAVLAAMGWLGRRLRFNGADTIAMQFCGSQKSLANGAPIAQILFAGHPGLGLILLPLILYHQIQLVVCTLLAQRYAARSDD
jgi:sodium/bile acid cotransporter 7